MAKKIPKKKALARVDLDRAERVTVEEAVSLVRKTAYAKFDETVDVAVRLGVNPRHADQMIRGALVLPHGLGKVARVLVFAKGEKEKEAEEAGADFIGSDELIEKIKEGWLEFDTAIAIPPMMGQVGRLGKILGPRGLMPNPKTGTVTMDISRAVKEAKAGKVNYRVEKAGIVHAPVGKLSFEDDKLIDNVMALIEVLVKARPAAAKGTYLKSITLSSTMGPGVKIDPQSLPTMK